MKKRILFVDDEPMILGGLQRMLRPFRQEWDMQFVESGARALERMAEGPFDVIVADMRMPGMNGVDLLNEVMNRHPLTVRLILSGQADKDLILKSVGSTHQFLAKPCEPEALRAIVSRAAKAGADLENSAVKTLVARMDRLPSAPSLYARIMELLQKPDVALEEVANVIQRDPGMTAKILKLVNSAFFGLSHEVSMIRDAAMYLGLDTIKALVLSVHAFSQYEHRRLGGIRLEQIWNHSLKTAFLARRISAAEEAAGNVREAAFTAGLLHDVGKLVLATNFVADYETAMVRAQTRRCPMVEVERELFKCSHAEVGGYLLGLWGIPLPVVDAILYHHTPVRSTAHGFCPLTAVHAANALSEMGETEDCSGQRSQIDSEYLAALGLSQRWAAWQQLPRIQAVET